MIIIDSFQPTDFETIRSFVESIQEHERAQVPELKQGVEIGLDYTKMLIDMIANRQGCILVARADNTTIGFACAWIDEDDDLLLREEARKYAYVSDLFVRETWRGQGIARLLLQAVGNEMQQHGCKYIRICTKASNHAALKCYEATGYSAYEIILSKSLAD
jgi:ribosomal protein S18 acetylase RimI-like enzyme